MLNGQEEENHHVLVSIFKIATFKAQGRTGKIWNLSSGTILVLMNNSREITCLIKFVF